MFRKPTRVSLLWFPETPTIYDALCTHNTTGFEFNMCLVSTTQFASYTQSEYIPTMPVHPEEALYTQSQYTPTMHFAVYTQWLYTRTIKFELYTQSQYTPTMLCLQRFYRLCVVPYLLCFYSHKKMVENIIHVISQYEERLRRCQNVPRLSHGRRMLTEDGAPNRFFLMYLFCNESMALQYLKDIGLIILRLDLVLFSNNLSPLAPSIQSSC